MKMRRLRMYFAVKWKFLGMVRVHFAVNSPSMVGCRSMRLYRIPVIEPKVGIMLGTQFFHGEWQLAQNCGGCAFEGSSAEPKPLVFLMVNCTFPMEWSLRAFEGIS